MFVYIWCCHQQRAILSRRLATSIKALARYGNCKSYVNVAWEEYPNVASFTRRCSSTIWFGNFTAQTRNYHVWTPWCARSTVIRMVEHHWDSANIGNRHVLPVAPHELSWMFVGKLVSRACSMRVPSSKSVAKTKSFQKRLSLLTCRWQDCLFKDFKSAEQEWVACGFTSHPIGGVSALLSANHLRTPTHISNMCQPPSANSQNTLRHSREKPSCL